MSWQLWHGAKAARLISAKACLAPMTLQLISGSHKLLLRGRSGGR